MQHAVLYGETDPCSGRVILVIVSVDDGDDGLVRDATERVANLARGSFALGHVNHDQSLASLQQNGVGKGVSHCHPHSVGHLQH